MGKCDCCCVDFWFRVVFIFSYLGGIATNTKSNYSGISEQPPFFFKQQIGELRSGNLMSGLVLCVLDSFSVRCTKWIYCIDWMVIMGWKLTFAKVNIGKQSVVRDNCQCTLLFMMVMIMMMIKMINYIYLKYFFQEDLKSTTEYSALWF